MDEDEYGSRRPRSRNWNTAEKFFLFEHVKNRFDTITDPRKESASINAKRRVWEQIYQAIAKEFGPLEEHLVRGKGGEKCRTQWKNLVQAARKEYKQYMEAKMVGKRHNMTLLSRKICRLMSIDLDDGLGDQDNEENDWTEDHPEFRYQPELCQELKEMARRINSDYAKGVYDTPLPNDSQDYDDLAIYEGEEEVGSDSEIEQADDDKDEDYAPSKRLGRKRRRPSSGRSSKVQPTRTSARAQAAQAKKAEAEKQAKKQKEVIEEGAISAGFQIGGVVATLSEQTQQEILNLHLVEHKKRMNMMNTEHKTKMHLLKVERDIMDLQKEYWSRKLDFLQESGIKKDMDDEDLEDEDDEDEDDDNMAGSLAGPSGTAASTSVVVPSQTVHTPDPASPAADISSPEAHQSVPPVAEAPSATGASSGDAMETDIPPSSTSNEDYTDAPRGGYPDAHNDNYPGAPPTNGYPSTAQNSYHGESEQETAALPPSNSVSQ